MWTGVLWQPQDGFWGTVQRMFWGLYKSIIAEKERAGDNGLQNWLQHRKTDRYIASCLQGQSLISRSIVHLISLVRRVHQPAVRSVQRSSSLAESLFINFLVIADISPCYVVRDHICAVTSPLHVLGKQDCHVPVSILRTGNDVTRGFHADCACVATLPNGIPMETTNDCTGVLNRPLLSFDRQ